MGEAAPTSIAVQKIVQLAESMIAPLSLRRA
jgi:hypothetical protein